ncbi:MAG: M81 family metallopeptidase [Candidatus Hodarchaeota archaeon]
MRIAIGAMMHETNTFTKIPTSITHFWTAKGEKIFTKAKWQGRNSSQGIIKQLLDEEYEIIPTFFARAIPSGVVERSTYDIIKNGIIDGICREEKLDGICLALHGSMYVEGLDDPEGDLLETIRSKIGSDIPITCALDMHATVTDKMVEHTDGFAAYKTAPHLDEYETGIRAAKLLTKILKTKKRLCMCFTRIPMLLSGEQSETDTPPMKGLIELLEKTEKKAEILDASYVLGFPWADSPHMGIGAITVGWIDSEAEVQISSFDLAKAFWEKRSEFQFTTEAYQTNKAINIALDDPGRPIIISDSGDNPTAGASQNMVQVLKYLLEQKLKSVLISAIADPKAYKRCFEVGSNRYIDLKIGKILPTQPSPLLLKQAFVEKITTYNDARIAIVSKDGINVIISDKRLALHKPSLIKDLGFNPSDFKIIIIKCGYQGPEYKAIAARSILALTPGDTAPILTELNYLKVPRPIYPLDTDTKWP